MNAFPIGRRRAVLGLSLAAVLLGATMGLVPGARSNTANAEESNCRLNDEIGLLCLSKDTRGGEGSFLFEIEILQSQIPAAAISCLIPGNTEMQSTEVLGGGEEVGIYFGCSVRVTEVPQRGWQLVDIDCEFNNTFYDVSREGNSVVILLDQSQLDSQGSGNNRVDCTFVNRRIEERQPLNLGGLFSGQPTPLPTAPSAVAPAATAPVITPPRTGDAGLK